MVKEEQTRVVEDINQSLVVSLKGVQTLVVLEPTN